MAQICIFDLLFEVLHSTCFHPFAQQQIQVNLWTRRLASLSKFIYNNIVRFRTQREHSIVDVDV